MGSTSSSDNVRQFIESAVNSNKVVIWYVTVANFFLHYFYFRGSLTLSYFVTATKPTIGPNRIVPIAHKPKICFNNNWE